MTEPDEALLWAREDYAKQFRSRRSHVADSILSGYWDIEVEVSLPAHAYRAGAAASAARIKELEARVAELEVQVEVLDWLTYQTDLQLSWDADPEEDWAWRVHGVTGNVNDREWRLIAEGETPLAALKNARAQLERPDQ